MSRDVPGGTASLVLGIVSIVANFPIVGLVVAYIGYQKARAAKALCDMSPGFYTNAGVAQAGYILCIIGMVLGSISTLCGCGYFAVVIAAIIGVATGTHQGGP